MDTLPSDQSAEGVEVRRALLVLVVLARCGVPSPQLPVAHTPDCLNDPFDYDFYSHEDQERLTYCYAVLQTLAKGKRKDSPMNMCTGCGKNGNTIFTREMKPGAKGGMGQSFARSYDLCEDCIAKCRSMGALLGLQTMRANGKKCTPRAKVAAKTLQFLRSQSEAS